MPESYESLLKREERLQYWIDYLQEELDGIADQIVKIEEFERDHDDWSYEDGVLGR